ncbi:MAG: hypothetical protein P4L84_12795 [Isosphaeraceae bacterium]|nr:hypothetical protein [Isosphaeraceae bacterium]
MVADYYAMLGVDPGADHVTIAAALARLQPVWSSGTRNPKNKHTFQSYLDQIPALRQALLGEPTARAAYDAELGAARRIERDRKLDRLQHLVQLRAAKGGLTVADRALLRDEAVRLGLSHDDLDRLVEPIPPKPEPPGEVDDPDPPVDAIDPVTRRQVRVALDHLGRRDLYDALGLERAAPLDEIAARADSERRRWMQKTQVTAEKTAWLEVVSLAQSHLGSPEARARYDRTLVLEAEDELNASIAFVLKGATRLDAGTRQALIDEGERLGIATDRVDRLLGRACRASGVARDGGSAPSAAVRPARLLRCRACGGVTDHASVAKAKGAADCRHCGASLQWTCPVCQRLKWVDEPRCGCGFPAEKREPLVRHFEAAQHAYRAREYLAALEHLQRVQELAPNHVGARKGVTKVQERLAELDKARSVWEAAYATGKLLAARTALQSWAALTDPTRPEIKQAWEKTVQALRDAQALAKRAQALEATDPKSARAHYRQALALASDLPEAIEGLRRCPPDPPVELHAEFQGDRVRLRWSAPPSDGSGNLRYVVRRKPHTSFQHPRDGIAIAETDAPEYVDTRVNPGEVISYAVLSKRGETESVAAVSLGPIYLLADVTDVRVETRAHEVELTWSTPAKAQQVRVVRKRGAPPAGPNDGERVEALAHRAVDTDLVEDQVYHYGVYALYRLLDGRLVPSPGVVVTAQPHAPVPPLDAPVLHVEPNGRLRLSWPAPLRGTVKVLRTTRPLPSPPGTPLEAAQAHAFGGEWLDVTALDHADDPSPPVLGVCYYTPLTNWAGLLTVGHTAAYSCLPDPSDLRAHRVRNGRVHLRWRWCPQATESLVVAKAGSPPQGPRDPDAIVTAVHEGDYHRHGHYALDLPATDNGTNAWHVSVYSVGSAEGETLISPGLEPTARTVVPGPHPEVTVAYTFQRGRFPARGWSVQFKTEPPGAAIPPLVLVTHPRTVPLAADDGSIVTHFPAATDGATVPLDGRIDLAHQRARIFPDPHAEPDTLTPIRLRHPQTATARV